MTHEDFMDAILKRQRSMVSAYPGFSAGTVRRVRSRRSAVRWSLALLIASFAVASTGAPPLQSPPPETFLVMPARPAPGPRITPYLRRQVELAWEQDDRRRADFGRIQDEAGLKALQRTLREKLISMIGGLPEQKTPLRPKITGTVRMNGYRIEKIVFESLPGFHVAALLYLPEAPAGPKPAVLVPCGHSANGKSHYQYICHRLAQRGYVALCWDPVGQGERSQFWDAGKRDSRYNRVCGEHAVLGNLAYLAGANLARWEIWDGMRALDYLLTRPEVDGRRISITGTSGGGFQAAHIAALDERIRVAVPSCYISALPMRMSNRIFEDPDSDPEQDLFGMVSEGVDHPGLLLLMYPRPVLVAAAVLDFFPIEGTRKTYREVAALYRRLGHAERIAITEGYHRHQYSAENLETAFAFLDRFNGMPAGRAFPPEEKLEESALQVTASGQVLLEFPDAKRLMDLIREYYHERKSQSVPGLPANYRGFGYPGVDRWECVEYKGHSEPGKIAWESAGSSRLEQWTIDKYILHHSETLSMPLLHIHAGAKRDGRLILWFSNGGKVGVRDWDEIREHLRQGFQVVSFDFRGMGEDRMPYTAGGASAPGEEQSERSYADPLLSVLANYVYNALLTGRPYFLQMIEDAEIAARFARAQFSPAEVHVTAPGEAYTLAVSIAEVLSAVQLMPRTGESALRWSRVVDQKVETWPVQFLMPRGAYIR